MFSKDTATSEIHTLSLNDALPIFGALATDPSDDVSYLALDLSGLNASLVGLEDVLVFNAWDIGVLLNRVSDGDTNAANRSAKLHSNALSPTTLLLRPHL